MYYMCVVHILQRSVFMFTCDEDLKEVVFYQNLAVNRTHSHSILISFQ